ncbi:MAG: hypothetical protein J6K89_02180, partial [Oscillospiraceae bacterium]|nr:hypothetical protein [Oscillospiraceae bacterium]
MDLNGIQRSFLIAPRETTATILYQIPIFRTIRRGAHCASGSWRNALNTKTAENDVFFPKIATFFTTTNVWWLSDAQWRLLKKSDFQNRTPSFAKNPLVFITKSLK